MIVMFALVSVYRRYHFGLRKVLLLLTEYSKMASLGQVDKVYLNIDE